MSAFGRLWRRAPLWRLAVGATLTVAALCALYPSPMLQRALASLNPDGSPPPATNSVAVPSMIATRRTLMPIAGRQLPLPAGDWHEVLTGRFEMAGENVETILARFTRGKLTGLIDAIATTSPSEGRFPLPPACLNPTNFAAHQQTDGSACWFVANTPPDEPGPADRPTIDEGARSRLRQLGVAMPSAMIRGAWFRAGDGEFMDVAIDLPSDHPDRVETWLKGWMPLLDNGFDGTLRAAQVTARLARDPGGP